jgi:hypothetical protein
MEEGEDAVAARFQLNRHGREGARPADFEIGDTAGLETQCH